MALQVSRARMIAAVAFVAGKDPPVAWWTAGRKEKPDAGSRTAVMGPIV